MVTVELHSRLLPDILCYPTTSLYLRKRLPLRYSILENSQLFDLALVAEKGTHTVAKINSFIACEL